MRHLSPFLVFAVAWACGSQQTHSPQTDAPARTPTAATNPLASGSCQAPIEQFCAAFPGGRCPTYEERLNHYRSRCGVFRVTAAQCPKRYRSLSAWEPRLGGSDEYFDRNGQLFARYASTDYFAYCGDTSFNQSWGTPPSCPESALTTDLC